MTAALHHRTPSARRLLAAGLAVLLGIVLPISARAQSNEDKKQFSEKVSEGLGKLGPLVSGPQPNYAAGLALLNELLAISAPGSYDFAVVSAQRGQFLAQIKPPEYLKAIEALEAAVRVSDQHNYFGRREDDNVARLLMQLHYQEAATAGKPPAQQQEHFSKAISYLKRIIDRNPRPTQDDLLTYATLLFHRALLIPDKPDHALVAESIKVAEQALYLVQKPRESAYQLLMAAYQQQQDYKKMSEMLEILVRDYPKNGSYWQQLFQVYYTMAADEKHPKFNKRSSFKNFVRSILTIERAQQNGLMNTPKDHMNLVGIYFTIDQFDKATQLLEQGMANGQIELDQKNVEFLAHAYQQVDKQQKAIQTLKKAAPNFPKSGQLDFQAAQIYWSLDDIENAYKQAKLAASKGVPDRNGMVWGFIAYCAFDLGKLEEALDAANKALTFPDGAKDKQLPMLKSAIEDKIKEREFNKEKLKRDQQRS